jgi:hypothetical protein
MTTLLWEKRTSWKNVWFVLIREAANWIYARLKVVKNDALAKADFIKSLREARHHGLAVGVDTIRWTSLDKEVRDISDFIFVKRVGAIGLPDDLRWLYRYVMPYSMMQLKANIFLLTTGRGAVGYGKFDYPSWHKEEKENVLESAGIEVKNTTSELPDDRRYGISDFEHSKIITAYLEKESMMTVAKDLGRSSETILRHIQRHNLSVETKGQCAKCFHANSEHSQKIIKVPSR